MAYDMGMNEAQPAVRTTSLGELEGFVLSALWEDVGVEHPLELLEEMLRSL